MTVTASLVVLLVPMVQLVEGTSTGSRVEWRNLLSLEGWGALLIVGVPVLVAAIPLALPRRGRWLGTVIVIFLMTAGVVLGILTIGVFYAPALILFVIAAVRARPRDRQAAAHQDMIR